jgi:juvenile hormone diol kinase
MLGSLQKRKLKRMFVFYDLDKDGVLTKDDFEILTKNFAKTRNLTIDSKEIMPLQGMFMKQWEDLVHIADTNKDNKVTIDEWLVYWDKILSSEELYNAVVNGFGEFFFNLLDRDGDKKVSAKEYEEYISSFQVNDFDIKNIFSRLTNNTGVLELEDARRMGVEFFLKNEDELKGNFLFGPF